LLAVAARYDDLKVVALGSDCPKPNPCAPIIADMMKQISKQFLTMLALVLPLLGAAGTAGAASLVTTVVTDPLTGIAIGGYDPVSYFTEREPQMGRGDFEHVWAGVPWHFASAANLEVFRRSPEIYAPQYGGHGAMGVARGFLSQGNPRIYTVFKQRLFFFYSPANREAFLLTPDQAALDGEANWQSLSGQLSAQ
jgi:YHS domain-containing protein